MSAAGVIVITGGIVRNNTRRALDIHEFRSFAMVDTIAPLIFVNTNDSYDRQFFFAA